MERFVFICLICVISMDTISLCHKSGRDKQNFEQDLLKSVTSFRPMRRYMSNFIPGQMAKLIIIFQGRKTPQIRWFVNFGSNYSLPYAEIPNKINIDGNPKYSVKSLSSHDITVVTLRIHKLENKFPIDITTCFNYKYALFQYQLYTTIPGPTNYVMDMLDAVMWLGTPPYTIAYSLSGNITINCEARFESDSTGFIDEVHIYRTSLDNDRPIKGLSDQLVSLGCGKMHRRREGFVERTGKYTYIGGQKWETTRYGAQHRILKMTFTITNGSTADSGVYTCMAERGNDKTFSSTWIRQRDLRAPTMIFTPCEDTNIKREAPRHDPFPSRPRKPVFIINITRFQPTCVRCRAFDYLTSQIMLEKDGHNFTSSTDTVMLDNHINVPEGALSELTITFLRPTEKDAGTFRCSVTDDSGSDYINFRIQVVNRR